MLTNLEKEYYQNEWGKEIHDDKKLFEALVLETFQSGLSWKTILHKRENFRKAFDDFNPEIICKYDDNKIKELLKNEGIVRHEKKIKATVSNSKAFLKIKSEFGSFNNYIWSFVNYKPIINVYNNKNELPTTSPLSEKISTDMKKRGFKYIGSTTIYSYLQAIGIIKENIKDLD